MGLTRVFSDSKTRWMGEDKKKNIEKVAKNQFVLNAVLKTAVHEKSEDPMAVSFEKTDLLGRTTA